MPSPHYDTLFEKIRSRTATVAVIGLGYVGLPLAIAFAKQFPVIGYDVNTTIVSDLGNGRSHILDITDEKLQTVLKTSPFVFVQNQPHPPPRDHEEPDTAFR